MRDFRQKDKENAEASSLRCLRFFVKKCGVMIERRTSSEKMHILLYDKTSTMPHSFSQAKSPSDDGLFACEIVYTKRERRGYINGAVQRNMISNP